MPFYRLILKKAFKLSFRHKWLWIFGFFAAFIGNTSFYEALVRTLNNLSANQSPFLIFKDYAKMGVLALLAPENIKRLWEADSTAFGMLIFAAICYLAVIVILIVLGVISQGSSIAGAIKLDEGHKIGFREAFALGTKHFGVVLKINVITKVILLGALVLVGYLLSLINISTSVNFVIYNISFVLFIIFGIILFFLTTYGAAFAILRGKSPVQSLKSAFNLFKKHIILNLEMGFILFAMSVLFSFVVMVGLFLLFSPALLIYVVFLFSAMDQASSVLFMTIGVLLFLLVVLSFSWFSTFQITVWALLFEELELRGGKSKLIRLFEHVKTKIGRTR